MGCANKHGQADFRDRQRRPPSGMTLVELLVAMAIVGLLIAMLLPAVQVARESARRAECSSRLKQIALAMHAFDQAHGRLPSAETWVPDASSAAGKRFTGGSAFVALLPYVEQLPLAQRYNPQLEIHSGPNAEVANAMIPQFCCPSMVFFDGREPAPGWSSYAVCTGSNYGHFVNSRDPQYHNGAIVDPRPRGEASRRRKTSIADISAMDGASQTFLVGDLDYGLSNIAAMSGGGAEFGGSTRWAESYPFACQASVAGVFNSSRIVTPFLEWYTFRSDHPRGVNMALVDGSVHFVADSTSPDTLKRLARCDDGESVDAF